uniref:CSON011352 protein n=1 Tax=Culicoides sonorensis TaxID=179676 RepID=A0A336KK44_CULSO
MKYLICSLTITLLCITVINGSPILEKLLGKKKGGDDSKTVYLAQKLVPAKVSVGEPIPQKPIRVVQIQEMRPMVRKVTITQDVPVQKTIMVRKVVTVNEPRTMVKDYVTYVKGPVTKPNVIEAQYAQAGAGASSVGGQQPVVVQVPPQGGAVGGQSFSAASAGASASGGTGGQPLVIQLPAGMGQGGAGGSGQPIVIPLPAGSGYGQMMLQFAGAGAGASSGSGAQRQPLIIPIPQKQDDGPQTPIVIPIPFSAGKQQPSYQPIYVPYQGPKGDESPIVVPLPAPSVKRQQQSRPLVVPFNSGSSQGGLSQNTIIPLVLSATQGNQGQSRPQSTQLHPVSSSTSQGYSGGSASNNDNNLIPLVISATLQQHQHKFNGQNSGSQTSQNNNNFVPLLVSATQAARPVSSSNQGNSFNKGSSFSQSNSYTQAILPALVSQTQGGSSSQSHSQTVSQSNNNVIPLVLSVVGQQNQQQQHGKGSSNFGGGYSKNQVDDAYEFSKPQKSHEISSFTVKSQQNSQSTSQQSSGQHPGGPYP